MAYTNLKDYLKDWFKAHHFHMMPAPVRAQWEKLRDDEEDTFDVVTAETQGLYREFIRDTVKFGINPETGANYTYTITAHAGNLEELRRIAGNPNLQMEDKYTFPIPDADEREAYLRVMSPKLGDKFYYNDLRSGGQKAWADKKTGNLADRQYPDIEQLSVPEQERFYKIVRTALRNIKDNPAEFTDPDNPPKVDNYLGPGKAFKVFAIQSVSGLDKTVAIERLAEFAKLADTNNILYSKLETALVSRFSGDYGFSEFISDLQEKTIRPRALAKVPMVLNVVDSWQSDLTVDAGLKRQLANIFGTHRDLELLAQSVNQEAEEVNPTELAMFKDKRNINGYMQLLKDLYDPSKEGKKSAFNDQFRNADGEQITKPMDLVVKNFDYDKLTGSYKDKRNWRQQIQKDVGDWADDHIVKLWKRNLRHNYLELGAKGIVDAICKLEISPTDGLKKILDEKAKIKAIITQKSPVSEKGFDFLVEVLEKINNSGDMQKAFDGALKNGSKAEAIAKEIIKAAMAHQPPKVGEAKVALETLAVMRYDIFSFAGGKDISKAITSTNFFEGASFMKNDGVKFIVNAAQKAINLGLNGAFWTGVLGRNLIQSARGKISDEGIQKLTDSMDKIKENANNFTTFESATREFNEAKDNLMDFSVTQRANIVANRQRKRSMERNETLKHQKKAAWEDHKAAPGYRAIADEIGVYINDPSVGLSDAALEGFQNFRYSLGAVALNADDMVLLAQYKQYCETLAAKKLTPTQEALLIGEINTLTLSLENDGRSVRDFDNKRYQVHAEYKIAKDQLAYQTKKRTERAETKAEHNPGDAPLNEQESAMTLAWFWNACNGYDFGLNLNDFNFLKKHENQSQKLRFNLMANQRLGHAA